MLRCLRYILVCIVIAFAIFIGRPASAQPYYSEAAFKNSLIDVLFQYGMEVYYRGVDPQEASYVFQRILVLDCSHDGAQEFLNKIHGQYPNVLIKIHGCREIKKSEFSSYSKDIDLDAESFLATPSDDNSALADSAEYSQPQFPAEDSADEKQDMDNQGMPMAAFSAPVVNESNSSVESMPQLTNSFSLTESSKDETAKYISGLLDDCQQLKILSDKLKKEIKGIEIQVKAKDAVISQYKNQIVSYKNRDGASYASIAQDQRDLIRIQQGNIDYLQKELDEAKEQIAVNQFNADPAYDAMRREIAGSQLLAHEKEMDLEAKNREAQRLQKQLGELQAQLQLVKRILIEKNDIIKSLQEELDVIKLRSGQ